MLILKMAVKNLFRHRRRTLITSIAIAVGLIFYVFIDSLLLGWSGNTERQYLEYEVASGKIVKQSWWEEKDLLPLTSSIEDTEEITSLLDTMDVDYTPRIEFSGDLIFYKDPFPEDGVYPAKIVAIDPTTDGDIFALEDSMNNEHSRGEFLKQGSDGIIVGNVLADKLNMEIGYPVRLQFTGKSGYEELMDTQVIGIIKSGSHLININGVFLTLDAADYYLEMGGAVTGYSIKVPDGKPGESLLSDLRARLPAEYQLLGYEEIAADFMAMMQAEDSFVTLFIFLIFIIAAVGVTNTMMMAIFERRREIGMMRAQGFQDWKIQVMFFFEAGGIGILGTVAGLGLGALLNIWLVNTGMNYGALLSAEGDFIDFGGLVIDSYMKGVWSPNSFAIGGIFAVLISSLVAYVPTHRLLRKEIPDNLRMD